MKAQRGIDDVLVAFTSLTFRGFDHQRVPPPVPLLHEWSYQRRLDAILIARQHRGVVVLDL